MNRFVICYAHPQPHAFWLPLHEALNREMLLDDLRIIIPFCHAAFAGWNIGKGLQETSVRIDHEKTKLP